MHLCLTSRDSLAHVTVTTVESPRGNESMAHRTKPHINLRITEFRYNEQSCYDQCTENSAAELPAFDSPCSALTGCRSPREEKKPKCRHSKNTPHFWKGNIRSDFCHTGESGKRPPEPIDFGFPIGKIPPNFGLPFVPREFAKIGKSRGKPSYSGEELPPKITSNAA